MKKIRKAVIVTLPAKHIIFNSKGEVVDFGRTGYSATEIAKAHGAKTVEMGDWKDYLKPSTSQE